jgi:hypothetical protein
MLIVSSDQAGRAAGARARTADASALRPGIAGMGGFEMVLGE